MSSTNVSSSQEINNIYCASAQIIPTEKEVEIPPKAAKESQSMFDIKNGEGIELIVEDSKLREDGKLVDSKGNIVGNLGKKVFKTLISKNKETIRESEAVR